MLKNYENIMNMCNTIGLSVLEIKETRGMPIEVRGYLRQQPSFKINGVDMPTPKPFKIGVDLNHNQLPTRYIINKGATVLFWEDDSKTVVKKSAEDEYNKRLAFLTAYFQKTSRLSKNQANKYLDSLMDEDDLKALEFIQNNDIGEVVGNVMDSIGKGLESIGKSLQRSDTITVPKIPKLDQQVTTNVED